MTIFFASVLVALGIPLVGSEVADLLARHFGTMNALMRASEEDLSAIPTVGPKIAASVVSYFSLQPNRIVVGKLRRAGVRLADEERSEPAEQVLAGLRFVVTGRLPSFSRSEIEGRIKDLGGAVGSSISRNTSYLVAGEDAGSKLADAERLGVEVVDEETFQRIASGERATQLQVDAD